VRHEPVQIPGQFGKWVHTLFDASKSLNQLDTTANELKALATTFDGRSRSVSLADFAPQLRQAAQDMTPLTRKFLEYVSSKNKLPQLPRIYSSFLSILADQRNVVPASVTVAAPLTNQTRRELEEALRPYAGGAAKQLLLDVQVDPNLIGGMTVFMKGRYIDLSLKSRIEKHKTRILQSPTVKDQILRKEEETRLKELRASQPAPPMPNIPGFPAGAAPGGH